MWCNVQYCNCFKLLALSTHNKEIAYINADNLKSIMKWPVARAMYYALFHATSPMLVPSHTIGLQHAAFYWYRGINEYWVTYVLGAIISFKRLSWRTRGPDLSSLLHLHSPPL